MTDPAQQPDAPAIVSTPLVDLVERIEATAALDQPAEVLDTLAEAVAPPGPRRAALRGDWLGHALHPLLTDVPLGTWMSAAVLDLVGGRSSRRAATQLVAVGVVAAVPTAATGLAEWLEAEGDARRAGVAHANANGVALGLYTASLLARLRGRHLRGVVLGLAGAVAVTVGGFLGGHLAIARKVGSRHPRFDPHPPPPPPTV